jgi:hypothetical protein
MSTFACTDGKLKNPATADRLIDFRWGIDVVVTEKCRVELKGKRSERQPTSIPLEEDEPFFEPHFRIDPCPRKRNVCRCLRFIYR